MRLKSADDAMVHGLDQGRSAGWQEDHLDSLLFELVGLWMTWRIVEYQRYLEGQPFPGKVLEHIRHKA